MAYRRKIILIEGNAKCRHKKITCKGTLRQVDICVRPRTHTAPLTHCIRVYSILIHIEGGESNQKKRLDGQQFAKLGPITNRTD